MIRYSPSNCVRESSRLDKNQLTIQLLLLETMARNSVSERVIQSPEITGNLIDRGEMDPDDPGRHQLELDLGGLHALAILREFEGHRVLLIVNSDFDDVSQLDEWLARGQFDHYLTIAVRELIDLRLGQAQREPSAPSSRSTNMPNDPAEPSCEPSGSAVDGASSLQTILASVTIAVQSVLGNIR